MSNMLLWTRKLIMQQYHSMSIASSSKGYMHKAIWHCRLWWRDSKSQLKRLKADANLFYQMSKCFCRHRIFTGKAIISDLWHIVQATTRRWWLVKSFVTTTRLCNASLQYSHLDKLVSSLSNTDLRVMSFKNCRSIWTWKFLWKSAITLLESYL